MKFKDETGNRYGRLVVVSYAGEGKGLWNCRCDCGKMSKPRGADLQSGHTRSCGCLSAERIRAQSKAKTAYREIHGYTCFKCGLHKDNAEFPRLRQAYYSECRACNNTGVLRKLRKYLRRHPGYTPEDYVNYLASKILKPLERLKDEGD